MVLYTPLHGFQALSSPRVVKITVSVDNLLRIIVL